MTREEHETLMMCCVCNRMLVKTKVKLKYMNVKFETELYKCPECNQTYISEELAIGKIHDLEMALEEK